MACGQKLRLCFYYTFCCYCFSRETKSTKDYVAFKDSDAILATSEYAGARDHLEFKYGVPLRSNQLTATEIDQTTMKPPNLGKGYNNQPGREQAAYLPSQPVSQAPSALAPRSSEDGEAVSTKGLAHQLAAAKGFP
ncbi:MAG: hypothetical protein Q8P67_00205 [archaeon]|nr:hypothetical protein [archaeon]